MTQQKRNHAAALYQHLGWVWQDYGGRADQVDLKVKELRAREARHDSDRNNPQSCMSSP